MFFVVDERSHNLDNIDTCWTSICLEYYKYMFKECYVGKK